MVVPRSERTAKAVLVQIGALRMAAANPVCGIEASDRHRVETGFFNAPGRGSFHARKSWNRERNSRSAFEKNALRIAQPVKPERASQ